MGHIRPIEIECIGIVASKMIAYAREDEEYLLLFLKMLF
jgi:hypothetical protein